MYGPEKSGWQTLKNNFKASGLQIIMHEDITENVVRAIESEEPLKQKGSKIHRDLKSYSLVYHRFMLQKGNYCCPNREMLKRTRKST
jgi:hypothetical protein